MAEISEQSVPAPPMLARLRGFLAGNRSVICAAAIIVLAAWLSVSWFQTLSRMARYYTPLPTWDYWRTAAFLKRYQALDFSVLWQQHNEHRIVFPEIVFAADSVLAHGRQLIPLMVSFLCYFGSWLTLAWAFGRDRLLPPSVRALGILLAGLIIGWQGSAVVLSDTFLLQWTLMQFAVLLALTFLTRLRATERAADLIAVIAFAVVATYSSANGLLLWPVLLGAASLLRISKRQLTALTIAGSTSIGAYFIGYRFMGTLSPGNLVRHPVYLVEFIGAYLSMPFGAIKSTKFGVLVGLISLAFVMFFAIAAIRKRLLGSRIGVILFGWYLFMLLTVLVTAAGRMEPADPRLSGAKADRYLTGPLVTWAVFILLSLWLSSRLRWRLARPYAMAFVFAVLMLLGLPKLRWWLHGSDEAHAKDQMAALALELGIQDANVELAVFLDPPAVDNWEKPLREGHESVFYKGQSHWLGKPAASYARPGDSVIPGEITYSFPVLGGIEIAGWVDDLQLRGSKGWILLANERGQIAGFGRKLPAGFPDMLDNRRTPPTLGWVGFVNLNYAAGPVSAYAIDRRGLFPIEGTVDIPSVQPIRWQQGGPQIKGINWQMDASWVINRLPVQMFPGQGPKPPVYSSWNGNDGKTGRITSSVFPAPQNACLILPVLQGPRAGGLSAKVVNAQTGETIASVPFQSREHQWTYWRLPLAASAKQVRIEAEDKGTQWGEWLAIGIPSLCK